MQEARRDIPVVQLHRRPVVGWKAAQHQKQLKMIVVHRHEWQAHGPARPGSAEEGQVPDAVCMEGRGGVEAAQACISACCLVIQPGSDAPREQVAAQEGLACHGQVHLAGAASDERHA